jgi:hypothetical protein
MGTPSSLGLRQAAKDVGSTGARSRTWRVRLGPRGWPEWLSLGQRKRKAQLSSEAQGTARASSARFSHAPLPFPSVLQTPSPRVPTYSSTLPPHPRALPKQTGTRDSQRNAASSSSKSTVWPARRQPPAPAAGRGGCGLGRRRLLLTHLAVCLYRVLLQ